MGQRRSAAHGHRHGGGCEHRRIVDAVADHEDLAPGTSQRIDARDFGLRSQA
jgi:hypothetical protein